MNKTTKSLIMIGFVAGFGVIQSCTNLDEKLYDSIPTDQFGTNQEQLDALIGPLYGGMGDYYGNFAELNAATDEMVVPTRGGDWKDGDKWKRFEEHKWDKTLDDGNFNGIWNWAYGQIAKVNAQITNPAITDPKTQAEMKTIRAFYHYIAMDNFGKVPILTEETGASASSGDASASPAQSPRKDVYAFVEKELLAAIPLLSEDVGGTNYGRMTVWVARAILAKLYLNAEVYTGEPQWQKAFEQCDAIIKSGKFSIAADFFSNFTTQNQNSPEIILATPMDKTKRTGFTFQYATLHYNHKLTYDLGNSPWNGYSAASEFYESFDDADIRKKMWIVGQQYDIAGNPMNDETEPMIIDPVIPKFQMDAGPVGRLKGARSQKYEIQLHNHTADNSQDNDWVIYRLADIILMRGEASFRLGNKTDAVEDFNTIRRFRNVPDFTVAMTLDDILAERGRELAFEWHRRQDQIRFGTWTQAWTFHPADGDNHTIVYPIPQSQIALNPNLVQNDGY